MISKAVIADVPGILKLVNDHAREGKLLPRSFNYVYQNIRDFAVIEDHGKIVGCGSLHVLWSDLTEIRSVAVDADYLKEGCGQDLVRFLLEESCQLGIKHVFVLTNDQDFFRRMGFATVEKDDLPRKIWVECADCVKFAECDEVAMDIKVE